MWKTWPNSAATPTKPSANIPPDRLAVPSNASKGNARESLLCPFLQPVESYIIRRLCRWLMIPKRILPHNLGLRRTWERLLVKCYWSVTSRVAEFHHTLWRKSVLYKLEDKCYHFYGDFFCQNVVLESPLAPNLRLSKKGT